MCIYACTCMRASSVCIVVVVGRPRYMRFVSFFFSFATTALCRCLLGSLPYPPVLLFRSSHPVLPGTLFCVKPPPRGAHTHTHIRGRQRSEGTGPTEDRKDNVNAASLSFLSRQWRILRIKYEKRMKLRPFQISKVTSPAIKLKLNIVR